MNLKEEIKSEMPPRVAASAGSCSVGIPKIRIKISKGSEEISVETFLQKYVAKFGNTSGHIIVPKKFVGRRVIVLMEKEVGSWIKGFKAALKKKGLD